MDQEVLLVKVCQNKNMLFHDFLNYENILVLTRNAHTKCLNGCAVLRYCHN